MTTERSDTSEYRKAYARGWTTGVRGSESAMERADARDESTGWYDGYLDSSAGRERWHLLHCTDHDNC